MKPVDEDISKAEAEIAKWKESSRERLRDRLAGLFIEIEDGVVCEKAAKLHDKVEAEIRTRLDAEYQKKLAEAKIKIEAEIR